MGLINKTACCNHLSIEELMQRNGAVKMLWKKENGSVAVGKLRIVNTSFWEGWGIICLKKKIKKKILTYQMLQRKYQICINDCLYLCFLILFIFFFIAHWDQLNV